MPFSFMVSHNRSYVIMVSPACCQNDAYNISIINAKSSLQQCSHINTIKFKNKVVFLNLVLVLNEFAM